MLEPAAEGNLKLLAEGHAPAGSTVMEQIALSQAISLKRIADKLDGFDITPFGNQLLEIAYQAGVNFRGKA